MDVQAGVRFHETQKQKMWIDTDRKHCRLQHQSNRPTERKQTEKSTNKHRHSEREANTHREITQTTNRHREIERIKDQTRTR